ncbi:hypothetical protein J6590_073827 [Homalodisca vitripennis]|nr:hypothetical protein J6590_073827 [Homalodisca vitripennis]
MAACVQYELLTVPTVCESDHRAGNDDSEVSDVCNLDRNSPTSSTRAQLHRCLVLRGTNSKDLAAGEQHSIYLESHVTTRHFNTSLVISTVPYRRNLLGINEEITLLEARHFNTSLVISTVPYRRNLLGINEEITLLEGRHFNTSLVISTVPYRRNLLWINEEITLLEGRHFNTSLVISTVPYCRNVLVDESTLMKKSPYWKPTPMSWPLGTTLDS